MAKAKLILIDGSSFIFRAFHALPPLTRADSTPVNAVFGFIKMLLSLIESNSYDYIAVISDTGRATFRQDIYPDYKANRPPVPEELIPQFSLIKEAIKACNVIEIERLGFEADDLIASYAEASKKNDIEVMIVSSDKDLMQLIDEPNVYMFDSIKKKRIGVLEVLEKFNLPPSKVVDAQALIGDTSDNIPGVKGLGPKTAATLLEKFSSIEDIYENIDKVENQKVKEKLLLNKDLAFVSKKLATLVRDIEIDTEIEDLKKQDVNALTLYRFLLEQNFNSLAKTIGAKYSLDLSTAGADKSDFFAKSEVNPLLQKKYKVILIDSPNYFEEILEEAENNNFILLHFLKNENKTNISFIGGSRVIYIFENFNAAAGQNDLFSAPSNPLNESLKVFIAKLLDLSSLKKVFYSSKNFNKFFDIAKLESFDDISLMDYAVYGIKHQNDISNAVKSILQIEPKDYKINLETIPNNEETIALINETIYLKALYTELNPLLIKEKAKYIYEVLDKPLVKALSAMEKEGVLINRVILDELKNLYSLEANKIAAEVFKLSGEEFNLASPKQIGEVLFEKLNIKGSKNKSGSWKTESSVLEVLSESYPIADLLLKWRQLNKLITTYLEGLPKHINGESGRIHTTYLQSSVNTARLASINPNLQNIPIKTDLGKNIRKAFVSKNGYKILSLDYSQIELRILAVISDSDSLISAFAKKQDIHTATAMEIFNLKPEEVTPAFRRKAKTINFGIIYGISEFGLAKQLQISKFEAKNYIESYFKKYPEILNYMEEAKKEARTFGYVKTVDGRKCFIENINHKNYNLRSMGERAAINAKIQGTASDIMRKGLIDVYNYLEENRIDAKILLQIHDEIVIEVNNEIAESLAKKVQEILQNVISLCIPLESSYGIANNWLDAH